MTYLPKPSFAGPALLTILGGLFVFHVLILWGKIPYDIVWAGKIESRKELIQLESISLVILIVAAFVVALKMGYLTFFDHPRVAKIGMWVLFGFFVLNTIGNATAKNPVEKYGFGLLTLIMALLALRLAVNNKSKSNGKDTDRWFNRLPGQPYRQGINGAPNEF